MEIERGGLVRVIVVVDPVVICAAITMPSRGISLRNYENYQIYDHIKLPNHEWDKRRREGAAFSAMGLPRGKC
jgi:hypothetical protein